MALDDRDYMRRPVYSPPVHRRPWWQKIKLQNSLATVLLVCTVGSAVIWFVRDLSYFSGAFGSREGSLVVNVNTASIDELETLPGIGPALAQLIKAGRPYSTVDELEDVKGIGPRTMESLRPFVVVAGDTRKAK